MLGHKPPCNVDLLMELIVKSLNEEQLVQFFLATLNNRTFWEKVTDVVKTIILHLAKNGVNLSTLPLYLQEIIKQVILLSK
jgi:hypothetical protein